MNKTKPLKTWLRKNHQNVIFVMFGATLVLLGVVSNQIITVTNQKGVIAEKEAKINSYQSSLQLIDDNHRLEWQAHTEAMAYALLITDAYQQGGLEKAAELLSQVREKIDEATAKKQIIKLEVEKYGIVSPPESEEGV